jgi:hypothetical protein
MRVLPALLRLRVALVASLSSLTSLAVAAGAAAPAWPLWDGQESVEQYARRAGLERTKTLDLGSGIMMEAVALPHARTHNSRHPRPGDESLELV